MKRFASKTHRQIYRVRGGRIPWKNKAAAFSVLGDWWRIEPNRVSELPLIVVGPYQLRSKNESHWARSELNATEQTRARTYTGPGCSVIYRERKGVVVDRVINGRDH